ncbi:pyridoxal phosphate-dependent aminotransferase [Campylobacter sp. RM12327]|uniref:pyridoxal phosphate-dependent aminotransferase n=1 Tax=Campylobacter sputorum TaxID=206 RepID=UPI00053BD9FA|nr:MULTISPECIES: pyridoxal phosphate-dependent aminotransferase [Campylobacter]ASM40280.1 aspartate aminotransferase, aminotransferase, classes I and II [Campylobacter sputorum]MBE7357451.1 pyridoxal phosphate-dependent aminotransferase [Campylobacter sp. RM11302]MBF6668761.1 pyridoxal phosphate-dependent aminotransferase [Campylobacter sp. RM12327]MBF6674693.1 pyridoxal phosphate-dependent aminotransferase [Campylobacter sp. RM13538]MBF6675990.1 pyridoxal phosphate-dependent aminotransferase 
MNIHLANRAKSIKESVTIAISAKAKEMKANGIDVISLSAGEPDFDTPEIIKSAVKVALSQGCSKYTPIPGTLEVLQAIKTKLKKDNNLEYETNEIITNVGAKHSIFNIIQAMIEQGDEVIIPAPYWVSYPEIVKFAGGTPVIINTDESSKFKITAEQLKNAITTKSKLLILNSPSNPTGSIYTKEELSQFAKILKDTDIVVISDEIYEKLVFDGEFCATASISEDMLKRTITINGLSKCGAMPGWRFGYMACKIPELTKAVKSIQSQSTSNISSIVQAGAIPGLLGESNEDIAKMNKAYKERRDYAVKAINDIKGLKALKPDGAFYIFVNCSEIEKDSMKFCKDMLSEAKVAAVPGIGFGLDGYFRMSYATDLDSIKKAIDRIAKFVESYKK